MSGPFTELGVAGNIVQFLDFSIKLVVRGNELYKSADGSLGSLIEVEIVYRDLSNLSSTLKLPVAGDPKSAPTKYDGLVDIAISCQDLAKTLLDILQDFKVDPGQKHGKWKSFGQAQKSVWKQSQIEELEKRLNRLSKEMHLHLTRVLG